MFRKQRPAWLHEYAPYQAPFVGPASRLSPADAEANLSYLLANRESRLGILATVLESRVDLAAGLGAADVKPFLNELHAWTRDVFPAIFEPAIARRDVWLASERKGRQIVYSLLMDVAIALGECVIRRRNAYGWSLDLDPDNKADGMISYQRPVVQIPKGDPYPAPIIFDPECLVVDHYLSVPQPLFGRFDDLVRVVLEFTSGAHETPWQSSASS